jgi:hypothetical protein
MVDPKNTQMSKLRRILFLFSGWMKSLEQILITFHVGCPNKGTQPCLYNWIAQRKLQSTQRERVSLLNILSATYWFPFFFFFSSGRQSKEKENFSWKLLLKTLIYREKVVKNPQTKIWSLKLKCGRTTTFLKKKREISTTLLFLYF